MNHEIKRTECDGNVTRQFYDPDGQLIKVVRPNEYARAGEDGTGNRTEAFVICVYRRSLIVEILDQTIIR